MLLLPIDFDKKYQSKFSTYFKEFKNVDELEEYIKEKLECDNIRTYISDIIRALNIINGKDREDSIKTLNDKELIVKSNISENKEALLSWKDNDKISRYLKNIDDNKLKFLIKLEEIFKQDNIIGNKVNINHYIKDKDKRKERERKRERDLSYNDNMILNIKKYIPQSIKKVFGNI